MRASPSPLLSTRVCAQMVPHTSIQKASTDHATPSYRSFGKSAKSLVPTQRGCLAAQRLHASPLRCHFTSMCRIELPRIYVHNVTTLRIANRVNSPYFCLLCYCQRCVSSWDSTPCCNRCGTYIDSIPWLTHPCVIYVRYTPMKCTVCSQRSLHTDSMLWCASNGAYAPSSARCASVTSCNPRTVENTVGPH